LSLRSVIKLQTAYAGLTYNDEVNTFLFIQLGVKGYKYFIILPKLFD